MRQINSILTLTGDFNIDLLKIKDRPCIKDYFENMLSYGMLPSIVLPTRVAEHSATLIDNIFTNVSQNDIRTSGIFVTDISDHFPIFYSMKMNTNYKKLCRKYIYHHMINNHSVELFMEELKCLNFFDLLIGEPNSNYNILEGILTDLVEKHMPIKKLNFTNTNTKNQSGLL